jgi:hypothetical protein
MTLDDGIAAQGAISNMVPPPVSISLPRAWIDVILHPKSERFRQWFPWVTHRWMAASFALSTALVVLAGVERAVLIFIVPARASDPPKVPYALVTFVSHVVGSVGTTFAMALGVAFLMNRAYGPLRIRFREYALRPWLLAQPAICLVLLIAYPLSAWFNTLDTTSWPLEGFTSLLLFTCTLIPYNYGFFLTQESFCAGSGLDRGQVLYVILLPVGLITLLLIWALPFYVAHWLG